MAKEINQASGGRRRGERRGHGKEERRRRSDEDFQVRPNQARQPNQTRPDPSWMCPHAKYPSHTNETDFLKRGRGGIRQSFPTFLHAFIVRLKHW